MTKETKIIVGTGFSLMAAVLGIVLFHLFMVDPYKLSKREIDLAKHSKDGIKMFTDETLVKIRQQFFKSLYSSYDSMTKEHVENEFPEKLMQYASLIIIMETYLYRFGHLSKDQQDKFFDFDLTKDENLLSARIFRFLVVQMVKGETFEMRRMEVALKKHFNVPNTKWTKDDLENVKNSDLVKKIESECDEVFKEK